MRYLKAISLFLLLFYLPAFPAEIPVGSPVGERLAEISRELYGRGLLEGIEYSRPDSLSLDADSSAGYLAKHYRRLSDNFSSGTGGPHLSVGAWVSSESRIDDSNKGWLKLFPILNLDFGNRISARVLYRIDSRLDDDPRFDGKSWRGFSGLTEDAFIKYNGSSFDAQFGIRRVSWGFGSHGNLMFSDRAMPMTQLGFGYRRWIFEFRSILGFLSPLKEQLDAMENDTAFFTDQQRYLSAHSLSIRPLDGLSVALREVVLYGGPGRRLEPTYAFPFLWYHGEQLNSRMDDNTMFGLAADFRHARRLWIYGELLVDDFQADNDTRGDYEPNQLAGLGGLELYDFPTRRLTIGLEYARANNWTFNQARSQNRYINANYPIGFPDGPDCDILNWRLAFWPADFARIAYTGLHRRVGEGRIDSPWSRPWLDVDRYSEPFPTGTVNRTLYNSLEVLFLVKDIFWSNFRLDFSDISNIENISGNDRRFWEFWANFSIKIPPYKWE